MIETQVLDWLSALVEQSPALAILAYVAYRLEKRIGACIEHQENLIDKLIGADTDEP